ncbi:S26 family signal peptidase [Qipengyuania qiaonensis]|uniref:S26 family signal peptidase n=1 Tax=Qipengyuania qiaonensis TaxID=2867240 RepID=A0ABS7J6Y3_9SPHN|nr:S26 family signal peptidase [Qipengyuania qiaonensis]MBX7481634.1 S26 family signal peptidase [Qipengyuania qiaonensis]
MRRRTAVITGVIASATLASAAFPLAQVLVWNTTASVPTGLYRIERADDLQIGDRVAIAPPPALRTLLAERGYLPAGVPLLKELAATEGQTVCRTGLAITIDGAQRALAREHDRLGRALPSWAGCRTLQADEIFLLNASAPDSFDGRYFGPLEHDAVIGRALPVWTDEAGDGARIWFAKPALRLPPPRNQGEDQ